MASLRPLYAMFLLPFLTGALPGCAEYRECGVGGCPSDEKITASVQARLDQDASFGPPGSIQVQTLNRVVFLNGEVDVGSEKATAASEAKQVRGVTRIVNNIDVQH
jgi:osmotically-inducible protein OsmY